MSGSVENAALELRTGGMAIVADEHGGTLVLGALFATGRVIEFIAREARGPVCLALPAAGGGGTVTPLATVGTLPELDRRADAVRSVAESLAAGRAANATRAQLYPDSGDNWSRVEAPAVSVARLDSALKLASLAGLSGAAVLCPIRGESGAAVGPTGLASFGRRHDLPAVDAAEVLGYDARRVERRSARRPRPRVFTRASGFAQRLVAPGLPVRSG
jgi:3,4-dihydroxy 2-butanone 4-phosphate synthase/GTP cyclohydrolase II